MAIPKYDWADLKWRYFSSNEITVVWFLKKEIWIKKMNWWSWSKTRGWAEEKLQIRTEAMEIAKENAKQKYIDIYTPSQKEISEIYRSTMFAIAAKAKSIEQKIKTMPDWTIIIPPDVNMKDLEDIWKIAKTERWESYKIADREDIVPLADPNEGREDVTFYLPDNGREDLKEWQRAIES